MSQSTSAERHIHPVPADMQTQHAHRLLTSSNSTPWNQAIAMLHLMDPDKNLLGYATTGPMSASGNRSAFDRPVMSAMDSLAEALGLDVEGGWVQVWKSMDRDRKRLCELVWAKRRWADEQDSANHHTYCFCTKYLPRAMSAVIAEPYPLLEASPYDLILWGACDTPLVQYYLRAHPDLAIALRDKYYRKCLQAARMTLPADDLFLRLAPHCFVIHSCVVSYVSSPTSTSEQKSPLVPLPPTSVKKLSPLLLNVFDMASGRDGKHPPESYRWCGRPKDNVSITLKAMLVQDVLADYPRLLDPEVGPTGLDFWACRGLGFPDSELSTTGIMAIAKERGPVLDCFERDPKQMKACARCRVVYYCCKEHQNHHWKYGQHKPMCQKIVWDEL